jgi:ribonuclease D
MSIHLHKKDLPEGLDFGSSVAVDTETQGLSMVRDKLCLVQLSSGDGDAHIVQMDRQNYDCPNLTALLVNPDVEKIFHFARFDVAVLKRDLGVDIGPIFCTKIASALTRTYTDLHGLKYLCKELLNIDLSKQQQSSDWASESLSDAQLEYAASDVLYLHQLQRILIARLIREERHELAKACFAFLPARAELDLKGWHDVDIFSHSFR